MATASATARCPAPTIPQAAYFTRGSGHNEKAQYTEREDDYINNMDRLAHKFEVMRQHVPAAGGAISAEGARIGFVAFGTSDYAVRESCDQLKAEYGIEASYLRLEGLSVHAAPAGLHPPPRARLRGGSEPRRAVAGPDAPGIRRRS